MPLKIKIAVASAIVLLGIGIAGYLIYNSDRNVCVRKVKSSTVVAQEAYVAIIKAGSYERYFEQKVEECISNQGIVEK